MAGPQSSGFVDVNSLSLAWREKEKEPERSGQHSANGGKAAELQNNGKGKSKSNDPALAKLGRRTRRLSY